MTTQKVQVGTGPCFLLFLVFLVLKLCNVVAWSWVWVTAPLWIPIGLAIAIIGVAIVLSVIVKLID